MANAKPTSNLFPPQIVAAAKAAEAETGCPAVVTLAQWAIESGYGHFKAAPFNYFGMKWFPGCKYPYQTRITHEWNARAQMMDTREARFQSFPDLATAFAEHGRLLMNRRGPYRSAIPLLPNISAFIDKMAPIYATDPNYAKKLKQVIGELKSFFTASV